MTWLQFSIALAAAYILYYGVNILWDLSRRPKSKPRARNVLRFTENPASVVVSDIPDPDDGDLPGASMPEFPENPPEAGGDDNPNNDNPNNDNSSNENSGKEVTTTEEEPFITFHEVQAVVSPTGGVPVRALVELFRQQVVVQSAAIPFH